MRSLVRGSLVATTAATALLLTGCGGGDGGGDGRGGEDFAEQSAEDIADAAKEAMGELDAVRVEGTLTSDGQEIELDIHVGDGENCSGSFTTQGATAEILGVEGTTWFRPDAAFWELQAGPEAAASIVAAAGDRWVRLPDDDTSFAEFCDIDMFLEELTDTDDATYTKGDTEEIDGEQAVEIISERQDEGVSSGYVRTEGDHYLVRIEKAEGDNGGTVDFSGFDEQPEVEEPADDEQVTLEELQQSG
jgi:hypothetical protein